MPPKPRFHLPGVPQHVVKRANNRLACFFAEADYLFYLDALRTAADKFGGRIHAYVWIVTAKWRSETTPDTFDTSGGGS